MDSKRQLQVKAIIYKNGIKENWIAQSLNIAPQTLNFQLNGAHSLREDYYERIIELFTKSGIEIATADACHEISGLTIGISRTFNFQLGLFQNEVEKIISDGTVDPTETDKLKSMCEQFRAEIFNALKKVETIEKVIG
jgi:hypothetical protein